MIPTLRECQILQRMNHPNIIKVKDFFMTDCMEYGMDARCSQWQSEGLSWFVHGDGVHILCFKVLWFVNEQGDYDLFHLIHRKKVKFNQEEMKCIMFQVLNGLKYLHDQKVFHRDIKGRFTFTLSRIDANILIFKSGIVKLCDFGLARFYLKDDGNTPYSGDKITLNYRPPEILLSDTYYSSKIDIWSAGVVFVNMLMRCLYINGRSEREVLDKIFSICGSRVVCYNRLSCSERRWPAVFALSPCVFHLLQR